jgi:hypothetical protein
MGSALVQRTDQNKEKHENNSDTEEPDQQISNYDKPSPTRTWILAANGDHNEKQSDCNRNTRPENGFTIVISNIKENCGQAANQR